MGYQEERRDRFNDAVRAIKLAAGCLDCGYNAEAVALGFDHRPGERKRFGIAKAANRAWPEVLAEMAKCDIVCANCHNIRTAQRRQL